MKSYVSVAVVPPSVPVIILKWPFLMCPPNELDLIEDDMSFVQNVQREPDWARPF